MAKANPAEVKKMEAQLQQIRKDKRFNDTRMGMNRESREEVEVNESVKPKLITPKEMADYKVKKVLAVGTKPNNESIVATCDWGGKKFVQLEKMGKTWGVDQIVQATFFDTEKEAMDEMRDRGFKIHA